MTATLTVFIGGSRNVTASPCAILKRLSRIMDLGFSVVIGDADGVDRAVQTCLEQASYRHVTVFYSGDRPRNLLADWPVRPVAAPSGIRGYHFHAAKDLAMAHESDIGFMIWDGASPGTALNVLRLVDLSKIAILANVRDNSTHNFRSTTDWTGFIARTSSRLRESLRARATPAERHLIV